MAKPPESPRMPATRIAYDRKNAAFQLCMGVDHFDSHVRPFLKASYVGGKTLYRHTDLERFLDRNQG